MLEGVAARRDLREAFLDLLCLLWLCRFLLGFLGGAEPDAPAARCLDFAWAGLGSSSETVASLVGPRDPEAASEIAFRLCFPDRLTRLSLAFLLRRGGSEISEAPSGPPKLPSSAPGAGGAPAGSSLGVLSAECQLDFASPVPE